MPTEPMKTKPKYQFTKEEIEKLLADQREICSDEWRNGRISESIKDAYAPSIELYLVPEPEVPDGGVSAEGEEYSLLRETAMRSNLCFPENEQDEKWFNETCDATKSGDFMERLFYAMKLGNENKFVKSSPPTPGKTAEEVLRCEMFKEQPDPEDLQEWIEEYKDFFSLSVRAMELFASPYKEEISRLKAKCEALTSSMLDVAQQSCIELKKLNTDFARWCMEHSCLELENGKYYNSSSDYTVESITELYELWLKNRRAKG